MPSIIEYLSFHFCNPGRSIPLIVDVKASRPGKLDWGGFYVPTTSRMDHLLIYHYHKSEHIFPLYRRPIGMLQEISEDNDSVSYKFASTLSLIISCGSDLTHRRSSLVVIMNT